MSDPPIAERAYRDIAAAERQMRLQAEAGLREYARLLSDAAAHCAGSALEQARALDPSAPRSWTPAQWEAFLTQHVYRAPQAWGRPADELEAENQRLRRELAALRQAAKKPPAAPAAPDPDPPPEAPPLPPDAPWSHAQLLDLLRSRSAPAIPARFTRPFDGVEPLRWERQSLALFLLLGCGVCLRPEIEHLLALAGGGEKRTTAIRQALDHLGRLGFLQTRRWELRQPLATSLVTLAPTGSGLDLGRALGLPVVTSEVGRLEPRNLPPEHSLAALVFVQQARLRGWAALAAPPPEGELQPDAWAEGDGRRWRVFVGAEPEALFARWQAAAGQAIPAAICALDEPTRAHLAALGRASGHAGAAVDLGGLVSQRLPAAGMSFWKDVW